MKLLTIVISTAVFAACGMHEETSQHKFEVRKQAEKVAQYHAKYKFALDGYESVDTAIKIEAKNDRATVMWLKDLTRTNNELEKAVLSSTGGAAFSGLSEGELGGTYTGKLELDGDGKVSGCCSQMTFRPTVDSSLLFVGIKTEVITATEWDELLSEDSTTPTTPEVVTMSLGAKKIGKLFSITTSVKVRRLEAQSSNGIVIEDALGQWKSTAGADIFAVQGTHSLFLTGNEKDDANIAVSKLVGFDADDNKVLEASLSIAERDNNITVQAEHYADGQYTWVAFSANPNPDPENPSSIKDSTRNSYLNLNRDNTIHDYHTGFHNFSGRDGRGFWVGMYNFDCPVGNRLLARVGDDIYHGSCNTEDSWWND